MRGFFYIYKMRFFLYTIVLMVCSKISYCQYHDLPKIKYYAGTIGQFQFFKLKDTLQITVKEFIKNDATCFTEGIPYALIICDVNNNKNYPKVISVLAICDNHTYNKGDKLNIVQSYDARIGSSSLNPIYFTKDSTVNKKIFFYILGSEYPAVWGYVVH
jgi:hypothetical protein